MSRYIDADLLLKTLNDNGWLKDDFIKDTPEMLAVRAIIDELSTADVVEVVHAEWIANSKYGLPKCSACGKCSHSGNWHEENNYCGRCGARMDKERENNEIDR